MSVEIESNTVTSVTRTNLEVIIMLIHFIPLANNRIVGGDLDDRFLLRIGRPYDLGRRTLDFTITSRRIVHKLNEFLDNGGTMPEDFNQYSIGNLVHFVDTLRENYSDDRDVSRLLESSNIENLIGMQN